MATVSHFVVLHYHLRAGGVRRVIEVTLPAIARELGLRKVTLASGEAAPDEWMRNLEKQMPGVSLVQFVEPSFRYASEQRVRNFRNRIGPAVTRLAVDADAIWFHNPSLARNVPLVEAVNDAGVRALFHHHDLWVDNRWARWPELRAQGYRSLAQVARIVFPGTASHATINRLDDGVFRKASKLRSDWLPNPAGRDKAVSPKAVNSAGKWLARELGDSGPVWIFPTRFLRRKNLAEAVLLSRWLNPEGWLVTTAAVSSKDEFDYARRLQAAATKGGWRARFGMLVNAPADAPEISAVVAASDVVMMTSVQEGFGLPCIEAVAAGKPFIARRLPNVTPDLRRLGFQLPCLYDDVMVGPAVFDVAAERKRQESVFARWRRSLPAGVRRHAACPLVHKTGPIAFSHLTLTAQLEILSQPPAAAWAECRKWNPQLEKIGKTARLEPEPWPGSADARLSPETYARAFRKLIFAKPVDDGRSGAALQQAFVEQRLGSDFVFPILIE